MNAEYCKCTINNKNLLWICRPISILYATHTYTITKVIWIPNKGIYNRICGFPHKLIWNNISTNSFQYFSVLLPLILISFSYEFHIQWKTKNKNIFIVAQHSVLIVKKRVATSTATHSFTHTHTHKNLIRVLRYYENFKHTLTIIFILYNFFAVYVCVSTVMPRVKFFSSFNEKKKRKKSNKNEFFSSYFSEA